MSVRHSTLNFSGFFSITSLSSTRKHWINTIKFLLSESGVCKTQCSVWIGNTYAELRIGCSGSGGRGPSAAWCLSRWPSWGSLWSCQPCRSLELNSTGTCNHFWQRKSEINPQKALPCLQFCFIFISGPTIGKGVSVCGRSLLNTRLAGLTTWGGF